MPRTAAFTRAVPAATGARRPLGGRVATGVPASSTRRPKPRQLAGWELVLDPAFNVPNHPDVVELDPLQEAMVMAPTTYSWLKNDAQALQDLIGVGKAEAVRQMKVTMWEGARYAPKADPAREPKKVGGGAGIKQLCLDLQQLTARLAALDASDADAVGAAALEYARYRDRMAVLRAAFTEAEGSFELAQELLVSKMGVE